ncbi:MAG: O-antigen ligase family protein [Pirellulales bacterium]
MVLVLTLEGRSRNMVLGGIAAVGLVVGATQMDKIVGFQREQSAADTAESASMRVGFAYVSWLMFQDRPIVGFGFGRFPVDKLPYLDDRSTDINLECLREYVHHNTFLSILVDTGLIGLVLFLAMLTYWMLEAWHTVRSTGVPRWAKLQAALLMGAVPVYVAQLLFHELSYTPMDNSLVFFLAGCSSALAPLASAAGVSAQRNRFGSLAPCTTPRSRWADQRGEGWGEGSEQMPKHECRSEEQVRSCFVLLSSFELRRSLSSPHPIPLPRSEPNRNHRRAGGEGTKQESFEFGRRLLPSELQSAAAGV